jgi:hypothetical protein
LFFLCAIKLKKQSNMKKVTLILSFFMLACAGSSFGQTPVKQIKATPAKAPAKAIAAVTPTGTNEAKPKPKPKPKPSGGGGKDYLLELDGVKGESQ